MSDVVPKSDAIMEGATFQSSVEENNSKEDEFVLSDQQLKEIHDAFALFDSDGSGSIDANEIKIAMDALGFDIYEDEARKMIAEIDADGSGSIELEEFTAMMAIKYAERSKSDTMNKSKPGDASNEEQAATWTQIGISGLREEISIQNRHAHAITPVLPPPAQ